MVHGPLMCLTQALPFIASATMTFLFLTPTATKTAGASDIGLDPMSHLSVQKKVDMPFPKLNVVAAWNTATTIRSVDLSASCPPERAWHS